MFSSKLWYFMLFPVVIVIVLFVVGNYAVGYWGDGLSGVIEAKMTEWIEGISWLEWVSGVAGFLVKLLTRFLYYILFISFGGYVVMVVMSPVYSWLSERTEAIVSGREYPFNLKQLVWEIGRGIAISLRCMILQLLVMIVLFFGSFIPLAGLVMPVLTFGVGAYFYGFAFMDYAVERKRFRVKERIAVFDRSHYEDVVMPHVYGTYPEDVWRARYDQINDFERELAASGCAILKIFLVVSQEEQKKHFLGRLDDPTKFWKFDISDLEARDRWDEYMAAWQEVFEKTSTAAAPWYLVPADNRWYSRAVVSELLRTTLKNMNMTWPPLEPEVDPDEVRRRLA